MKRDSMKCDRCSFYEFVRTKVLTTSLLVVRTLVLITVSITLEHTRKNIHKRTASNEFETHLDAVSRSCF